MPKLKPRVGVLIVNDLRNMKPNTGMPTREEFHEKRDPLVYLDKEAHKRFAERLLGSSTKPEVTKSAI